MPGRAVCPVPRGAAAGAEERGCLVLGRGCPVLGICGAHRGKSRIPLRARSRATGYVVDGPFSTKELRLFPSRPSRALRARPALSAAGPARTLRTRFIWSSRIWWATAKDPLCPPLSIPGYPVQAEFMIRVIRVVFDANGPGSAGYLWMVTVTLPGGGSHISPCSWPCMRPASPDRDELTAEVVGSHTKRTGVTDVTAAAGRGREAEGAA